MAKSFINKVTHVITTIERGGAENQLLILCQEQKRLGLQVDVLYLKGSPSLAKDFEQIGVPVSQLVGNPIWQVFKLRKLLRHGNSDVIHAHLPRAELISSLAVRETLFVVSRHNAERFLPFGPTWLSKILSKLVISKSRARIAISQHVSEFIERSGETVKGREFSVIHYGYRFGEKETKKQLTKNGDLRLVSIGRLVPQKDYFTLLTALSRLPKENLDFHLIVLGEGPMDGELKEFAKRLDLELSVSWLGKVDNVHNFLVSADFLILSSLYEGFGLVVLEAMDAQTPIICSNIPTLVEILGSNYRGFFEVQNPDSLVKTLKFALEHNGDLLRDMKSRMGKFDAERMANEIYLLYRSILKN